MPGAVLPRRLMPGPLLAGLARKAAQEGRWGPPVTAILIIEDDPGLSRALVITLRARGYEVRSAGTGRAGLDAAASAHPDVVVLDLGLPDMDGIEVLRALRGWSQVPVVILSARQTSQDQVQALQAGADDYVAKPFRMDVLLARLHAASRRGSGQPL